ncbi:MAG: hypothetical protein IPN42_06600 [Methylococcaceae bacterium]|nr:hypothetical protein [Methylococcaceae bacterium]
MQESDPQQATEIRLQAINAGSKNAAFYTDEAKARWEAGDSAGALSILDQAKSNGCADDYITSLRASILQESDPQQATEIRLQAINAGSKNAVFYTDEAKARWKAGDSAGALSILDQAKSNGCADDYITALRANIL